MQHVTMRPRVASAIVRAAATGTGDRPPRRPRLDGLDAARGLAVLGMFAAHVAPLHDPVDLGDPSTWGALVHGRSSVLFALCAGVSLVLATTGPSDRGRVRDRRHVLARAALLLAMGALLTLVPGGILVILPTYAVLFVAALPFLRLRLRWVVLAAVLALVAGPPIALVGQSVAALSGVGLADPLFSGYPAVSWFGVVLAGVLLARLGLERRRVLWGALGSGIGAAVLGYGGGTLVAHAFGISGPVGTMIPVSDLPGSSTGSGSGSVTIPTGSSATMVVPEQQPLPEVNWARLLDLSPHGGSTFELLGAIGVAVAVLAAALLLTAVAPLRLRPLSSIGRCALTLYCGHVLAIGAWVVAGRPDPLPALDGWFPYLVLVVVAAVTAVLLDRAGRRGPLEALARRCARSLDDRTGSSSSDDETRDGTTEVIPAPRPAVT